MPKYIAKINGLYCEWSTIVDAPTTYLLTLDQFREHYRTEYGESGMRQLDERLARVDLQGTSSQLGHTPGDLVASNHAGDGGECLTLAELVEQYTLPTE